MVKQSNYYEQRKERRGMGSANTGSPDTIDLKAFLLLSGAHLLTAPLIGK